MADPGLEDYGGDKVDGPGSVVIIDGSEVPLNMVIKVATAKAMDQQLEMLNESSEQPLNIRERNTVRANGKKEQSVCVNMDKCTDCGACTDVCPIGVFGANGGEDYHFTEASISFCSGATHCGFCLDACEGDAITITKL